VASALLRGRSFSLLGDVALQRGEKECAKPSSALICIDQVFFV
jgi:hypothetical protein